MAEIQDGFGQSPLKIRIHVAENRDRKAEVWVEDRCKYNQLHHETLSYATLDELLALRDEINQAVKDIVGV